MTTTEAPTLLEALLERVPEHTWITAADLAELVRQGRGDVSARLSTLYSRGLVERREIEPGSQRYEWRRRMPANGVAQGGDRPAPPTAPSPGLQRVFDAKRAEQDPLDGFVLVVQVRGGLLGEAVSFGKTGQLTLGLGAWEMLGRAAHVQALYNPRTRMVALRPADKQLPSALKVSGGTLGHISCSVALGSLLKRFSVAIPKAQRYQPRQAGDAIVFGPLPEAQP